ncbi:acyltransferase family protein [Synechococcus sp. BA-132 BA5]|uniref:acyltransferase family protein n=1 Tax=Synechococcus sp. BA-132 BA5 TaxID=3110252 RepID=UPI002B21BF58|nr:acyltransferase family protein [Synechococcus sp. BA-132 BA5]
MPGVLPAVLGTLLVLQAGPGEGGRFLPGRWLERGLLTAGLLSYSLYLWHWPVIVLLRWTLGMETWWQYGLAVVGSVVLAVGAYGLVEQPVRRHPLTWWWEMVLALLAVVGLWLGIDALHHQFRGRLFIGSDPTPVPRHERVQEWDPTILGTLIGKNCTLNYWTPYGPESRPNYDHCQKPGRPGAGEIFLLGDSHAQHLLPMLDVLTSRTGQRITFSNKPSCFLDPALTLELNQKPYQPCTDFAAGEMERAIERLKPGDIVMISSNLHNYLASALGSGSEVESSARLDGQPRNISELRQAHQASMRAYALLLQQRGIQLVLVVDNPPLSQDIVFCPKGSQRSCALDPKVTAARQSLIASILNEAAAGLKNVHVFNPAKALLDASGKVRYRDEKGNVIYSDSHHLSVTGSRSLAEPFERFLVESGLIPAPSR